MYLERLELKGFKSFATKTVLEFPRPHDRSYGITAIVGPNGSGKSNIADAIRWVLGEQSLKLLRAKASEELLFSGSKKRGRVSAAEVSVFLNNEDGAAPIEYAELAITRRMFRSGESEYMINRSKARLIDILLLLARAQFGQKSYSIIGQGMIDRVLISTPAERKDFFDEAVGIKEYQIKKNQTSSKLDRTRSNLEQTGALLAEIAPRLRSLTRQVKKLEKREVLEGELRAMQEIFYGRLWHENDKKLGIQSLKLKGIDSERKEKAGKIEKIRKKLQVFATEESRNQAYQNLQNEYNRLLARKNEMLREQTVLKGRMDLEYEKQGQANVVWLGKKKENLALRLADTEKDVAETAMIVSRNEKSANKERQAASEIAESIKKSQRGLEDLKKQLASIHTKTDPQDRILEEIDRISQAQGRLVRNLQEAKDIEEVKVSLNAAQGIGKRIRELMAKIAAGFYRATESDETRAVSDNILKIQDEINELLRDKDAAVERANAATVELEILKQKASLLESERDRMAKEIERIELDIAKAKAPKDKKSQEGIFKKENESLERDIRAMDQALKSVNREMTDFNEKEERKKRELLEFERQQQVILQDLNRLTGSANEIRIEIARLETRQEDLEAEIKKELSSASSIKKAEPARDDRSTEDIQEEIRKLKYQLELIGGIDPESIKEYEETKERHDFLFDQSEDMRKAMVSLEKAIKELDDTIGRQFDESFRKINKEFSKYFRMLFGGGSAKLVKVMEDETNNDHDDDTEQNASRSDSSGAVTEAARPKQRPKKVYKGIDITVNPPGKKLTNVTALSGGEKTMVSLALISAVISANPSPFVVLDEVDAALDEANSVKMAEIIKELSEKTQFIMITHNRTTMNVADVLYGVTESDDGSSRMLSVRLEEAKEHAARR